MSARIHFNHKEVVFSQSVQRSLQLELLSVPELNWATIYLAHMLVLIHSLACANRRVRGLL